jgi:hypothetical protein
VIARRVIPFFVLAILAGCVSHYEPPLPNQPHAVVKIRRAYASHAGTTLSEAAFIGEDQVMAQDRASDLDATQTSAVRVHPGPIVWQVGSTYTHTEMQHVQEYYTEQVPYMASESYNCGSGSTYRSCTRSVTRYRSERKSRWVNKQVTVVDAQCERSLRQLVEDGHIYLLQYSYTADDVCSLVCLEQLARPDGQFDTKPCRAQ